MGILIVWIACGLVSFYPWQSHMTFFLAITDLVCDIASLLLIRELSQCIGWFCCALCCFWLWRSFPSTESGHWTRECTNVSSIHTQTLASHLSTDLLVSVLRFISHYFYDQIICLSFLVFLLLRFFIEQSNQTILFVESYDIWFLAVFAKIISCFTY